MTDAQELADRTLVWSYRDINGYTLESCKWYNSDQFRDLHFAAGKFIRDQLSQFYAEFSEWFNLADFPDVVEQMEASEVPVFIRVAGFAGDGSTIEYCDSFSGLRAVIRCRIDQFARTDQNGPGAIQLDHRLRVGPVRRPRQRRDSNRICRRGCAKYAKADFGSPARRLGYSGT